MILSGLRICGKEGAWDIEVRNGLIQSISCSDTQDTQRKTEARIDLPEALAFPGLINSHDHLDFNLFNKLGSRIYSNYVEWAHTIHKSYPREIEDIIRIPRSLRVKWGEYKNLLNGFTTVVHHGDYLKIDNPMIDIVQSSLSLHSVRFEKNWRWKINRPSIRKKIVTIHVGEGTDENSTIEIDELIRGNIFKRTLVGVHAVAMTNQQAKNFKALVWCPASNHFLLGQTAPVDRLSQHTRIVFGTDSTLTSDWNCWTQIREARSTNMVSDQQLFDILTVTPANVWNLSNQGAISPGNLANLVIAKKPDSNRDWNSFFSLNPKDLLLVIHRGFIRLYDQSIKTSLFTAGLQPNDFGMIHFGQSTKFVPRELPALAQEIKKLHPKIVLPFGI